MMNRLKQLASLALSGVGIVLVGIVAFLLLSLFLIWGLADRSPIAFIVQGFNEGWVVAVKDLGWRAICGLILLVLFGFIWAGFKAIDLATGWRRKRKEQPIQTRTVQPK